MLGSVFNKVAGLRPYRSGNRKTYLFFLGFFQTYAFHLLKKNTFDIQRQCKKQQHGGVMQESCF